MAVTDDILPKGCHPYGVDEQRKEALVASCSCSWNRLLPQPAPIFFGARLTVPFLWQLWGWMVGNGANAVVPAGGWLLEEHPYTDSGG